MRPDGEPLEGAGGGGVLAGALPSPSATAVAGREGSPTRWTGFEAYLLDQVQAAVIATDDQGRITHWNRHAEGLFGRAAEDALGQNFREHFVDPSRAEDAGAIRTRVLAGTPWEGELPLRRSDGETILCYVSLSPIRDPDGNVSGVVSVSVDITERVRQERLLAARTAVTRVLAEASDLADASPLILQGVCENLGWELGSVWRVDESAVVLRCVDLWGVPGSDRTAFEDVTRSIAFSPGVGLPGRVWKGATSAWIPDVAADDNFPRAAAAAEAGLHAAFGFPIRRGPTILGVLEFFSREIRQPDKLLISTMHVIGSQIGQFIERVEAESALRESEAQTRAILEAALDCVITMDARGRIVEFNPAAERTFGYRRADVVGQTMAELIIPASLRPRHRQGLARYLATGEGSILGKRIELTGMRADGSEFPVEVTLTRVDVPGPPLFTGYLRDITERKRAEEQLVESRERLRLALEAGKLGTWQWDIAGDRLAWDETLEAIYGFAPGEFPGTYQAYMDRIHPEDRQWVQEAVSRSLEAGASHQFEHRVMWPDGTEHWVEDRGQVVRDDGGRPAGMIGIAADITERKRVEDAQRFLSEAAAVLSSSLDYEATLRQIARLAVAPLGGRPLADWCAIHIVDEGGVAQQLAVEHVDPGRLALAEQLQQRYPPDDRAPRGVPEVIRTGRSEVYPEISDEMLVAAARDDEHLAILRGLGFRSAMVVPLSVGARVLGAITMASAESGRTYTPSDLALAEDLAHRAALAVENARLYEMKREMAQKLQEGFLPPELPEIPGIELAGRYRWGGQGEVGGDFFDAFATGTGSWAVVIGDVCGKGPEAAVVTALARYTIRAVAKRETKPSRVLAALNDAVREQRSDRTFCTVCYARLKIRDNGVRATICCGGHPLPIVLRADGTVESAGALGTLLGIFPQPELLDRPVDLEPGDALVLFTDGVIEERAPGAVFGRERLESVVRASAGLDANGIAEAIEQAILSFRPDPPRDDIAILVARARP